MIHSSDLPMMLCTESNTVCFKIYAYIKIILYEAGEQEGGGGLGKEHEKL